MSGCAPLAGTSGDGSGCDRARKTRSLGQAPEGTLVFESPPDERLFCPICSEILRKACSPSHCGHWFCEACLKKHLAENGGTCPCCRAECEIDRTVPQHHPRSMISELRAVCRFGLVQTAAGSWVRGEPGCAGLCPEVFSLESLAVHEKVCPFAVVKCGFPGCGEEVRRSDLEAHVRDAVGKHLQLVMADLQGAREELQDLRARNAANELKISRLERAGKEPSQGCSSGNGSMMISAQATGSVKVWNLEDWSCKKIIEGHSGAVESLAVLPGGKHVISGSEDKTLKVWNIENGSCERTLEGHTGEVWAVAVLPGGNRIVSASTDDTVKVWNLEDGSCERTLEGHRFAVRAVAVLPGGNRIVSASNDDTVKVWNLEDGSCVRTLEGHSDAIGSLVVLPGGNRIVSASDDTTLKVWNLEDGSCERTLEGHIDCVYTVAMLPGGNHVISASDDETLKVWNLEDGSCERTLEGHSDCVRAMAVLPGGDRVVSASHDDTVKVWNLEDGSCERSCSILGGELCNGLCVPYDETVSITARD